MKKYIKPEINVILSQMQTIIAASQSGVTTNSKLGEEYNSSDVTYVKENSSSDIWNDNEW